MPGAVGSVARPYDTVVLLGPTAVGKTAIAAALAATFGWQVISADSRQVYRGLDIGSGKDLAEYTVALGSGDDARVVQVPYRLIDIVDLDAEYNVFSFQRDFYALLDDAQKAGTIAFVAGGTGMYIDSIVRGYDFAQVPQDPDLRSRLGGMGMEELGAYLLSLRPDLHTRRNLADRERATRAIEIALYMQSPKAQAARQSRPTVRPFVMGTTLPRDLLRQRIQARLTQRIGQGMIEEVRALHQGGVPWQRLESLGLEYRFVSEFLQGKIASQQEMQERLYHAICQFAKRQETWFRGMEKKGVAIHWLPPVEDTHARYQAAVRLVTDNVLATP